MKTSAIAFTALLCASGPGSFAQSAKAAPASPVTSFYTSLSQPACKTVEVQPEGGNSTQKCPGVSGYQLLLLDSDSRMSITVVRPDGQQHPLDFWRVITPHFSSLGSKAEWRVTKKGPRLEPVALIARVNANEDPDSGKVTSYLAVAKITPGEICVVDRIKPGPNANAEARRAADSSAERACLKP